MVMGNENESGRDGLSPFADGVRQTLKEDSILGALWFKVERITSAGASFKIDPTNHHALC